MKYQNDEAEWDSEKMSRNDCVDGKTECCDGYFKSQIRNFKVEI